MQKVSSLDRPEIFKQDFYTQRMNQRFDVKNYEGFEQDRKELREIIERMEAPVLPIKVQTPFPKLKSFLSAAIIFSYLGYEDEIKALLLLLSHKTGLYYQKH